MDLLTGSPRIRRGTWSLPDMTAAYEIRQFPRQSDNQRWFNPVDPYGGVALAAEEVDAFDGSRGGYGGIEFSMLLIRLTPLMTRYLREILFQENRSDTFTVMTWDRGDLWRVINCTGLWNEPARSADQPSGWDGYSNLRIDFIDGELADPGNVLLLEDGRPIRLEDGNYLELES